MNKYNPKKLLGILIFKSEKRNQEQNVWLLLWNIGQRPGVHGCGETVSHWDMSSFGSYSCCSTVTLCERLSAVRLLFWAVGGGCWLALICSVKTTAFGHSTITSPVPEWGHCTEKSNKVVFSEASLLCLLRYLGRNEAHVVIPDTQSSVPLSHKGNLACVFAAFWRLLSFRAIKYVLLLSCPQEESIATTFMKPFVPVV